MAYCFTFVDENGRVTWMGDVDCATDVSAVVRAALTLRTRANGASVEITNQWRLITRLTREEVAG